MRIDWERITSTPITPYATARPMIQSGDVFASATDTRSWRRRLRYPLGWAIQAFTGSPVNHVGLVCWIETYGQQRLGVLEACREGVRVSALSYHVPEPHNVGLGVKVPDDRDKVLILRPTYEYEEGARAAVRFAWEHLHRRYDVRDLLRIATWKITRWWPGSFNDARVICSGLVGRALAEGGCRIEPANGRVWSPREIVEHDSMALVGRLC